MTKEQITTLLFFLLSLLGCLMAIAEPSPSPYQGVPSKLFSEGKYLEAVSVDKKIPDFPWAYEDGEALALSYFYYYRFTETLQRVSRIISSPKCSEFVNSLGLSLQPGNLDSAIESIESSSIPEGQKDLLKLVALINNSRFERAIAFAQEIKSEASQSIPENRLFKLLSAQAYYKLKKIRSAYGIVNEAVSKYEDYLPYHELRVVLEIEGKIPGEAFDDLQACQRLGADPYFLASNSGRMYHGIRQFETAIGYLTKAIEINDKVGMLYFLRGDCYRFTDKIEEAKEDYTTAYNLDSGIPEAIVNLAILTRESGDYHVALQLFDEAIFAHPDFQSAYVERGSFFYLNGLIDSALKDYDKAIEMTPKDPYPPYMAARMLAQYMKYEQAKKYAEMVTDINPEYDRIYVVLGDIARGEGELNESMDYYEEALELGDNIDAARGLARVALEIRKYDKCVSAARKALEISPDDHNSLYLYGMGLLGKGKLDQAEKAFNHIIAMDEGFALAHYGLALLYLSNQEMTRGVNKLQDAIRWNPNPQYLYFRVVLGVLDRGLMIEDEEQVIEQISDSFEKLSYDFIKAALAHDEEKLLTLAKAMEALDEGKHKWLAETIIYQLNTKKPITRPTVRDKVKRTIMAFYISLIHYARDDKYSAKTILESLPNSMDYLSPEYHLAMLFFSKVINPGNYK